MSTNIDHYAEPAPSEDERIADDEMREDDNWTQTSDPQVVREMLLRVIGKARAEEREKCAQIAEKHYPKFTGFDLPNAIRAQGNA